MFSKTKSCPFCGSQKSEPLNNNDLSTNFYVEEIFFDLKLSFKFIKKKLKKKR